MEQGALRDSGAPLRGITCNVPLLSFQRVTGEQILYMGLEHSNIQSHGFVHTFDTPQLIPCEEMI
ncbi:hypothetical protein C451_11010 [Halococcus thailandensis JCM 13552]|uniref:Uncharacterized protein n=1 Tax=Halococcus thailandensis JCM 13552 TaxID=1227457 RepID=M0N8H3_9EURY|nr:hypothetical protein C451_11010 [Halococcus thailandensis JCM 13552]